MKELAQAALNQAQLLGAHYSDVRVMEARSQSLSVKNGRVEGISDSSSLGFGVRVLKDGCWGFAASFRTEAAEGARVARLALDIAKASATVRGEAVQLSALPSVQAAYQGLMETDPFAVPLGDKIALLLAADELTRTNKGVSISKATMSFLFKKTLFMNTEGSEIVQRIVDSGAGLKATAIKNGEIQMRSYPQSGGDFAQRGYEWVQAMNLADNAARTGEEAVALLSAKPCPSARTTLVLGAQQMTLQVHESIGHPTELDRVLGMEAGYAGTSFVALGYLGQFQYASPIVTVQADATIPGGLGSFGYDDEGVPAQKFDLVREGRLVGLMSNRETAGGLDTTGGRSAGASGRASNGTARAQDWSSIPLIRMTNINIVPGEKSLEHIIAEVPDGIFMESNKSWSIDDKRINFQFATEVGYEIRGGRLGAMLKDCNYTGITPEFWRSCDAVGSRDEWRMWGVPNCGKGEPSQIAHVGHGTAPARFRDVQVGVGK